MCPRHRLLRATCSDSIISITRSIFVTARSSRKRLVTCFSFTTPPWFTARDVRLHDRAERHAIAVRQLRDVEDDDVVALASDGAQPIGKRARNSQFVAARVHGHRNGHRPRLRRVRCLHTAPRSRILRRNDGECANGGAAAAHSFQRRRDEERAGGRQPIEVAEDPKDRAGCLKRPRGCRRQVH